VYKASGNEPAVEEGEEQEVELDCMRKWWVLVGKEQGGEEVSCSFTFQVSIPMTATPPCRFCCWSPVW